MVERLKKIYKSFSRVPLPQHLWDVDDMQQLSESIGSYIRERFAISYMRKVFWLFLLAHVFMFFFVELTDQYYEFLMLI